MPTQKYCDRIDTIELKHRIETRLSPLKSDIYFNLLNKYFSLQIHKSEFSRLCIRLMGRKNVHLHNELLRAILNNTCLSKVPPHKNDDIARGPKTCPSKSNGGAGLSKMTNSELANGFDKGILRLFCRNLCPEPPKKVRTPNLRDHKCKDRPSPLSPHGKPQTMGFKDSISKHSLNECDEAEQIDAVRFRFHSRSPIRAPLGVCLSGKGKSKNSCNKSSPFLNSDMCYNNAKLPDTNSLRKRLEETLEAENLCISADCSDVLNIGLDMYLKRLIKPCMDLATLRSKNTVSVEVENQSYVVNGAQKSGNKSVSVSTTDFRVAMESNPVILGQDWPVQLEKVSSYASEEQSW